MISDSQRVDHKNSISHERGIFSELDRKKIRQVLTLFKDKKYPELKHQLKIQKQEENKKENDKPSITEKIYRKHFSWKSYPAELDEIPMLFLMRTHLWPILENQSQIQLEPLQFLCEMSGIGSLTIDQDDRNSNTYIMKGFLTNGGPIEKCTFTMNYIGSKDNVIIVDLTFHRKE